MDRGAWWATVHRVMKSWTELKHLSTHEPGLANENPCDWFRFGCLTRAGQCGFAWDFCLRKRLSVGSGFAELMECCCGAHVRLHGGKTCLCVELAQRKQ